MAAMVVMAEKVVRGEKPVVSGMAEPVEPAVVAATVAREASGVMRSAVPSTYPRGV